MSLPFGAGPTVGQSACSSSGSSRPIQSHAAASASHHPVHRRRSTSPLSNPPPSHLSSSTPTSLHRSSTRNTPLSQPLASSSAALDLPQSSDDVSPSPAQSRSSTSSSTTSSTNHASSHPTTPATPPPMPTADIPRPSRWRVPSLTQPVTWSLMLSYLLFMLIMPITALLTKAAAIPFPTFIARATEPVSLHAYYVTFSMALAAAAVNCVFGFLLAWVLVKYDFPGRKWLDAAVDLPFALPTSVAGLTLATVYSEDSVIGAFLASCGVHVVFTRLGVAIAMVFVSFPFVVRTMQPVLQEMEKEMEEAAWSLGATPWETFTKVLFPPLFPSLLTGTALAFSRARWGSSGPS
ncbi:MAG: hypothetical protein WDW38_005712 [Sanguina aurantia]